MIHNKLILSFKKLKSYLFLNYLISNISIQIFTYVKMAIIHFCLSYTINYSLL